MHVDIVKNRFANNISITSEGCWEWTASRNHDGYGYFSTLGENYAHRVSYILHKGFLNKDICVLHVCDNPPCVNPDHLFLGTRDDNNKDRATKGRTVSINTNKTHCKRGHEFNEKNTYYRKTGERMCRVCARDYQRERFNKLKGLV